MQLSGMTLTVRKRSTKVENLPVPFVPSQISYALILDFKPGPCGGRPLTNPLKHGKEFPSLITWDKGKGKAILLQAWTGPEGSRSLRFSDFKTIGT